MAEELSVKIKANADKLIEEIDKVRDKLDKVSAQSKTITIKTNASDVLLDLSKVATALNQLSTKSQNLTITTNAKDVTSDIKALNKEFNTLNKKQEINVTLSAGNVLNRLNNIANALGAIKDNRKINIVVGEGRTVNSAYSTLKDIRDIINTINKKSININGSVKMTGIGNAISQYDKVVTKLVELKDKEKVSINFNTVGFSTAYTQLTTINNLLKQISANRNITSNVKVNSRTRTNTGGNAGNTGNAGKGSQSYGDSSFDLSSTDLIGYVGRSTKGFGSLLEVISRVLYKVQGMGGAIGEAAVMTAKVTAAMVAVGIVGKLAFDGISLAVNVATTILESFGKILTTVLTPGWDTLKTTQQGVLSLSAALQTMGKINGQSVSTFEAQTASINLMNQAMYRAQQSAFSYKEVVNALQGVLPMALGKGMSAQDALNVTTGVAGVAKLTGLNQNQVLQETRDLFQGSITKGHSQVANALGISNEDINKYEGDTDGLVAYLLSKFSKYNEALKDYSNTPQGAIEQLQETIGIAGQAMIDKFGGVIVELAHTATNMFGTFVDGSGRWINANDEVVDSEGNVLGKVEELEGTINAFDATTTHFKLSDTLNGLVDMLADVGEYIAMCADRVYAWAEANGYIDKDKDIFENIGDLLKLCIGFLVDLSMATVDLGVSFVTWGTKIYNVLYPIVGVLELIISETAQVINSLKSVDSAVGALYKGDITGAKKLSDEADAYSANELEYRKKVVKEMATRMSDINTPVFNTNNDEANAGSITAWYKHIMGGSSNYISLADWQKKQANGGTPPSSIRGEASAEATKAQIQASKKAMQEQIQVLKDDLADQLDIYKRSMDAVEISFKDNAMSIGDYFEAKTKNEEAQSQARLDELSAEREVIQNTLYANEDDRNKALSKIDRQMSIYARNLEDSTRAIQEVTALQEQYTATLANLRNQTTSTGQATSEIGQATMQLDKYGTSKGVTSDITNKIVESSIKYGVDPKLAMAMMLQESGGNQNAVSPTGATGLFQLMPDTAKELGVDATDAMQNIDGGIRYLAQKLEEFDGDISKALASYNAGSGAVNQYNGVPPYAETQNYVSSITSTYKEMSNIPDIRPYMQDFMKEKSAGIMQAMAGGVEQGVSVGFSKWENQVMENTTEGCVEAVTKIGDTFSKFLGDELAKGVVNVPTLQANAKSAGIPEIPYDQSAVRPGDVVVFDKDEHVLIYKGQGKYVGNSSKRNKVIEQDASTFPMTPTSIIQTGSYGVNSNITGMSLRPSTKAGLEAKNQYDKALTDAITVEKDYYSLFGRGDTQAKQLVILKYSKEIEKARANKDETQITQLQVELADALQKVDLSFIKQDLDNNIKNLQLSAETMGYKVGLGLEDIGRAVNIYYEHVNGISSPIKAELDRLRELMATYETRGDLKNYFEIKTAIDKIYADLSSMFKSFIQRIDDLATYRTNMIDANFNMTTGQKNKAKQQVTSQKYADEAKAYQAELTNKISEYQDKLNLYGFQSEQVQKMPKGSAKDLATSQLHDLKNEINSLQFKEIPGLSQLVEYNNELAKIPTLMEQVHQSAKQAFEDGLNTFLTDGINNAKSLGEAFNNMIVSILKSIQKVFADRITLDVMNALFPTKDKTSKASTNTYNIANSELLDYNKDNAKNSWKNYNPLASSVDINALNPAAKAGTDITTGMTNLQQSLFSALTSVDATLAQIVARINQSVTSVNSTVSSLNGLGSPNVITDTSATNYDFKYTPKFADGGIVSGGGTGTSDSVHTMLSNGEGVITAQRVRQLGSNFIHAVNSGNFNYIYANMPKFAEGGVVGEVGMQTTAKGMTSFAKNIGTSVDASTVLNMALVKDESEAIEHFMRSGRGQKMLVDLTGANNRVINRNIRR